MSGLNKFIEQDKAKTTEEGLLLGNYHYAFEFYPHHEHPNITCISLTRYNEECKDCPMWDECYAIDPPYNCQADSMLPVSPYFDTYDLRYEPETGELYDCSGDDISEFSFIDKLAIIALVEGD